jgi:prolipoprotein diacylglyceryltransferase
VFWFDSAFPFLATEFHAGVGRYPNLPLYPTQLVSAAGSILLASALMVLFLRRRFDGQVAAVALMIEPIVRALTEAYRGDVRGTLFTVPAPAWLAQLAPGQSHAAAGGGFGLTTSQVMGLLFMGAGAVLYRWARRREGP